MGLVTSGIPRAFVQCLADLSQADVFIETGTFQGANARWAANVFATVHTIELAKALYDEHHAALAAIPGIQPLFGDSAEVLPQIVNDLPQDEPIVCWLDGHWSGGQTAGEQQECPLLTELHCLRERQNALNLIDDARLYLCAHPRPTSRSTGQPSRRFAVCSSPIGMFK